MRVAFFSAALLATNLVNAATPIDGWYTTLFGGYAYLPNNINKTYLNSTRSHSNYHPGYDAGGSLGFKSNPMRYEGEITYIDANIKKFRIDNVQQTGIKGYNNGILAMANVYYDFIGLMESIKPFLGVGIGYGWYHIKLGSLGPLAITSYANSNTSFTYQALAGLTYNFSENYALNVGYRYVAANRTNALGKTFQANLGNVGVIYRFDEGRYK